MAHAPSLTRSERASGIVERHETLMRDDGTWQVRDTAGSGKWHTVVDGHCTCPDYVFRHMTCKHLRAIAAEERELAQFCATWDADTTRRRLTSLRQLAQGADDAARAALDDLPGDFLSTGLNFDDDMALCDEYRGPYGSDGWPQPRPCCPDCGAELESRSYYVGGRGYKYFQVCTRDAEHQALAV